MTIKVVDGFRRLVVTLLVILIAGCVTARAQRSATAGVPGADRQAVRSVLGEQIGQQAQRPTEVQALEEPIDPESYILGSGDLLGISFMGGVDEVYEARVSPDGSLITPMFPVLQVGGMTLAEAEKLVQESWGENFPGTDIDVTLIEIRMFRVAVAGAVALPGTYIVTPVDRVSMAIEYAGGLLDEAYWREYFSQEISNARKSLETLKRQYDIKFASKRNAVIYHKDGTSTQVDLLRFERIASSEADPYLKDGDRLVVGFYHEESPSVSISGAVNVPGVYEWTDTDFLDDLVDLAGGTQADANLGAISLTRFNADSLVETREIDISLDGGTAIKLEPGDLILIPRSSVPVKRRSVEVKGEVMFPGEYPIVPGKTRISDVITMAGGFTQDAFIEGSRVIRPHSDMAREVEAEILFEVDPQRRTDFEEQFLRYNYRLLGYDRLATDFKALYVDGDQSYDLPLREGDVVEVPGNTKSVIMMGQVEKPGLYPYMEGWNYKDYIKAAGGFTKNARPNWTRLVQYNSSIWQKPRSSTEVGPGDLIFVPEAPDELAWDTFREALTVLGQMATIIVVVVTLSR